MNNDGMAIPTDLSELPYDPRLGTLHADMDAFYAAVEVLDDRTLLGKPLIIGHPGRRGVVSTASYEARKFGVHSAMPSLEALRRCPQGVWRPPRMKRYAELSRIVRDAFREFTPNIEPLSLDEAFLEVAGSLRLFGGAPAIATQLQNLVEERTGGLTVSVGVAENKFLAKLASDFQKPRGITIVPAGKAVEFLAPLHVRRLWGVGPKTALRLEKLGLKTCHDLVRVGEAFLTSQLGSSLGPHIWRLAQGIDSRKVESHHEAKSISTESTFGKDLNDLAAIDRFLFSAADQVSETLRESGLRARTVQLKVRTGSFRTFTRAQTLPDPSDLLEDFYDTARSLLRERIELKGEGVRLLGVGAKGLIESSTTQQRGLFDDTQDRQSQRTAAQLADAIRKQHGRSSLLRGRQLAPGDDPLIEVEDDPARIRRSELHD